MKRILSIIVTTMIISALMSCTISGLNSSDANFDYYETVSVKTGMNNSGTAGKTNEMYLGDVDEDGAITVKDVSIMKKVIAGSVEDSVFIRTLADVNKDGAITVKDLALVKKIVSGGMPAEKVIINIEDDDNGIAEYIDKNGDKAYIPAEFALSENADEQTINTGLVVIGPDGSEFVWIPTTVTALAARDFGSYFSGGGTLSGYYDETGLTAYQDMIRSVGKYGGFYMGRYEASKGGDGLPKSVRVTANNPGQIWVQFSPQDTVGKCEELYADNDTVQGFFPWGINWDTTLQWLIDSGCKTEAQINADSTSWGNYSDDTFSIGARGNYTGAWEEASANNIYDLAGNNWEWTQERYGSNYVMRGGGYNLMGGACPGSRYPAALRDPLPGNDHHPNVTFRVALYLK